METQTIDSFETYRLAEFSAAIEAGICLNHAGVAPMPARVKAAINAATVGMSGDPVKFFQQHLLAKMTGARERLARLMGVPPEHLCFTRNTAHGLSIVADGLDLQPGENIVTAACEYPAVVYPWYGQRWRGVETRLVATRPDGTLSLDDIAAKMDARTRVVALSWIQFGTGFRSDMRALTEMAHERGAIVVADLIQGLCARPCDVTGWEVDVAASGVYKWQLSPVGTGGLYVAPPVLERMNLVNMGASSVLNPTAFDSTVFTPKPTVQRYEEGSPNALGLIGLEAALSLIEEVGIERIGARVLELAEYAAAGLTDRGFTVYTPRDSGGRLHSGLVMFRHSTHANAYLMSALAEAGVTAADRGGSIRFAPHFYNNESDIDRALAALPA